MNETEVKEKRKYLTCDLCDNVNKNKPYDFSIIWFCDSCSNAMSHEDYYN